MPFIIVYSTYATETDANRISAAMIEQKLAACANIFPIHSCYAWLGNMVTDKEWGSILKTSTARWHELKAALEQSHPYDIPCIMKIEVSANDAYEAWIASATAPPGAAVES